MGITVFAIAISVMLILAVDKIRHGAKHSFANTISGTDLIVGARSGSVQLLLYSVFRIGNATNNIRWNSYRSIAKKDEIKWTIPISLGDSHKGFRVMGTNEDYFRYYHYGKKKGLRFITGGPFNDVFDTVLGAEVAKKLGYRLGDKIVVAHGIGVGGFTKHDDKPFVVSGIIAPTGTPIDRTVHVKLEGITAIHVDWQDGSRIPGMTISGDKLRKMDLTPKSITAFMVGLKSRLNSFQMIREINTFRGEPLLAILPGIALHELWSIMSTAEEALHAITILVVVGGLLGMVTMLISSLNERRREMAILRAVGAHPVHIGAMLLAEALLIAGLACFIGFLFFCVGMLFLQPIIEFRLGLVIPVTAPMIQELQILGYIMISGAIAGLLPAILAYRQSVVDGMAVKN